MKTRAKLFLILWIASIIASVLILPYILNVQSELLKEAGVTISTIILLALAQGIVTFGLAAFFGLILAEKTGFKLPLLTSWLEHKKISYKKTLFLSIILGSVAGLLIIFLDKFIFRQMIPLNMNVQLWQGFLACFYGGIAEEIIMRLFLVSLIAFILIKIFRKDKPNSIIVWTSIILISVIFGLAHLPITSAVTSITPIVIFRAILLNGIGGLIFGWLYWKKGLEAAIIAHFTADIFIQIVFPVFLR